MKTDTLLIGADDGLAGVYNLNGGTLEVSGNAEAGHGGSDALNQSGSATAKILGELSGGHGATGTSTYDLTGGELDVGLDAIIRALGEGVFNQAVDTTLTVASEVVVGDQAGSSGHYRQEDKVTMLRIGCK